MPSGENGPPASSGVDLPPGPVTLSSLSFPGPSRPSQGGSAWSLESTDRTLMLSL